MLLNVEKIQLIKNLYNEKLLKNKKYIEIQEILKIYRKGLIIMFNLKENDESIPNYLMENKIFGSCDICNKNSSFANRTCNKCFYKLIGENYEM